MDNLPLQPLVWETPLSGYIAFALSATNSYKIYADNMKYKLEYRLFGNAIRDETGFATINEAKAWAWNHYNEKMQPYVKPDSITDIRNWFKAAKPEPTSKDITTQIGCHYEEISEMDVSLDGETGDNEHLAKFYKSCSVGMSDHELYDVDKKELLDSLCDQIVTATGVAYMMGFDIEGALKEVIRSNNSKMVDGKFIFDDNGKITKPDSYSEPDLTPFISTMQILHKGE